MQRRRNYSLIFIAFCIFFLCGCVNTATPQKTKETKLNIYAVEYYSRAPITDGTVVLVDDAANKEVAQSFLDKEGRATFYELKDGNSYTAYFHQNVNGLDTIQSAHSFIYNVAQENVFFEMAMANSSNGLAVPIVMQNPELPNGCEITSLTAILNYYGYQVNKLHMAEHHLPKEPIKVVNGQRTGPNPNKAFAGNPSDHSLAFYVYPEPIVDAAMSYLESVKSNREATNISGATVEELKSYIGKGIPVLTWVTINWSDSAEMLDGATWQIIDSGETYLPYRNLHAVVLLGMDKEYAYIMNPLSGYEYIPVAKFTVAYEALERRAVIVH